MPLIKTEKIYFDGNDFVKRFNCDRQGQFTCSLPAKAAEVLGVEKAQGNTIDVCDKQFGDLIRKYNAATTTKRRVIKYKVQRTGYIMDEVEEKCIFSRSEISFCVGAAISVKAEVFIESTSIVGGEQVKRYSSEKSLISGPTSSVMDLEGAEVIPWTQEADDFFIRIRKSMEALMLAFGKICKADGVLNAIQNGGFLSIDDAQKEGK